MDCSLSLDVQRTMNSRQLFHSIPNTLCLVLVSSLLLLTFCSSSRFLCMLLSLSYNIALASWTPANCELTTFGGMFSERLDLPIRICTSNRLPSRPSLPSQAVQPMPLASVGRNSPRASFIRVLLVTLVRLRSVSPTLDQLAISPSGPTREELRRSICSSTATVV